MIRSYGALLVTLLLVPWLVGASANCVDNPALRLATHQRYLNERLQQNQFAAIDSLLTTLELPQQEYLLLRLLEQIPLSASVSPALKAWVQVQAQKVPKWLIESAHDGFVQQQLGYDFAARARLLISHWQQQQRIADYQQQLLAGRFRFKAIYYRENKQLTAEQAALLTAITLTPPYVLRRYSQQLIDLPVYLPDNQLLLTWLERSQDPALYGLLWQRKVDQNSLASLTSIPRLYAPEVAGNLLISASDNPELKSAALRQMTRLSPLPEPARLYLLAELRGQQYGAWVAALLMELNEPRWLLSLAEPVEAGEAARSVWPRTTISSATDGRSGL